MTAVGQIDPATAAVTYRPLSTLEECAAVVALEREIWGPDYDEALPVSLLKITAERGGILVGAFDREGGMAGFVYSFPAARSGRATQWSYKLAVADRFRNAGVAHRLKLQQRAHALEMGCGVIEWSFDPLQTTYGHFNFSKLGVVVEEYVEDLYGAAMVPLKYRGNPTDRFIAAWNLRDVRVERRAAALLAPGGDGPDDASESLDDGAGQANRTVRQGEWLECRDVALELAAPRVTVEIPAGFSDMLSRAPALAMDWRLWTRRIFNAYFSRGYRVEEFALDRRNRKGAYLLVRA